MSALTARAGFAAVAAGQLLYLPHQEDLASVALTVAAIVGFATAALEPARGRTLVVGLLIAAAASVGGVAAGLSAGFSLWSLPPIVFAVGVLMCASVARRGGHDFGVRAGAATAAFGSSLWVLLDPFNAVSVWLPGNLLNVAGFVAVAVAFREAPATEGAAPT
ncbi:MAG TPA: hypothetical protein VM582_02085 [Candidatus Thermoplasmatota archaeon]|nr:hypothetical protein [Candidatus Thermoplasmatota archaeon]